MNMRKLYRKSLLMIAADKFIEQVIKVFLTRTD